MTGERVLSAYTMLGRSCAGKIRNAQRRCREEREEGSRPTRCCPFGVAKGEFRSRPTRRWAICSGDQAPSLDKRRRRVVRWIFAAIREVIRKDLGALLVLLFVLEKGGRQC